MNGLPYPSLSQPELRSPSTSGPGFDDSVYQRLLRERIIFLGTQVDDEIANRLCAQILLLAAEDLHLPVQLLDLRNSGDTAGPHDRVVGYGAFSVGP